MDNDKELQLELLQDLNWDPRGNAANTSFAIEDGVITLPFNASRLFEKMARGQVAQPESGTSYPKPPYVPGLLVIYRRESDRQPRESERTTAIRSWPGAPATTGEDYRDILSARESEVLSLIADGQSNQEIAEQLCLALNTVKRHAYNIYAKLDVKKRTQAVSKARRLGLIA